MSDAPELLLANHLKALRLPTFLREHDKLARICATEGVDHIRYLARLTELELIDRERCMVERRIKSASGMGLGPMAACMPNSLLSKASIALTSRLSLH